MWLNLLIILCEMCFDLMDDMWGSGTPLSLAHLLGVRIPVGPLVLEDQHAALLVDDATLWLCNVSCCSCILDSFVRWR